jgi:hypothetical protein
MVKEAENTKKTANDQKDRSVDANPVCWLAIKCAHDSTNELTLPRTSYVSYTVTRSSVSVPVLSWNQPAYQKRTYTTHMR